MQLAFNHAFEDESYLPERSMWITPDRIFYVGLLGKTSVRVMGAAIIYVALEGSIGISIDHREPQLCNLAVVPPYVPHRVTSETRLLAALQLEAELLDLCRLPTPLNSLGPVDAPWFIEHVRRCQYELSALKGSPRLGSLEFDRMFFGRALTPKSVDRRIVDVIDTIKHCPTELWCAEACADEVHLSSSRFLHLFKKELDVPFRNFRAWKRARDLVRYLNLDSQMIHIALDMGYPDPSHFSHSIRQTYGLSPKDMFGLTRGLAIFS